MPCPICNKPVLASFRPFCSARCADIDLGKWFLGNYALASDEPLSDADMEVLETALLGEAQEKP